MYHIDSARASESPAEVADLMAGEGKIFKYSSLVAVRLCVDGLRSALL